MKTNTRYAPLENMIEGISKCLDEESAKRLLKYRADAKLQKRVDELADKCNEGQLTPQEQEEYGEYVRLGTFVAILKSKLRQRLAKGTR